MNNEFVWHICISTYEDNSMSKVNRHFTVSALHIVFVLDTPDVWIYNLYGKSSNARLRTELIGISPPPGTPPAAHFCYGSIIITYRLS